MLTKELSIAERVQPRFVEPMYAEAVRELPDGGLWAYEAKLDGYRCLAAKRNGGVVLWSRRGNGFTSRFPEIACACEKLPPDTLIDGEVVAIDESGRVSFNALQHSGANSQLQFYAFDILIHRGRSVLRLPLENRRELLEDALRKVNSPVLRSQAFDAKPADLIRAAKELELEGIIAKRKGSCYEPGRRRRVAEVQNQPLAGVCDRWLYTGQSVRCADCRLLRCRRAALCFQGKKRIQSATTPRTVPAL